MNGRDPEGLGLVDGTSALADLVDEAAEEAVKWGPRLVPEAAGAGAAVEETALAAGAAGGVTIGAAVVGGAAITATAAVGAKAVWEEYKARQAEKNLRETIALNAARQQKKRIQRLPKLPGVTPYSQQAHANPAAANQLNAYHNAAVNRTVGQGPVRTAKDVRRRFTPVDVGPLPRDVAATFRSNTYDEVRLGQPTVLYRSYSDPARKIGPFWTRTRPTGPLQTVIDSALDQNWGNRATDVVAIRVPAGQTVYEGPAGAQRGLVGGGGQVYVPNVDPSWEMKP